MMTNDAYVALLKGKLASGAMTDRQILEGAEELRRRADNRERVQGKTPSELARLAKAIRDMVIAHNAQQINLPRKPVGLEELLGQRHRQQNA